MKTYESAGDERARSLAILASTRFDILIAGGGINGAAIARDAVLRGLSVALIEREDFASGTSSRTSRLIHGGLRYLEHGHIRLVFESSRERRILMSVAPHLVRPLPFTWPVYDGARVPLWQIRAGLLAYDTLSLFRNVANHRGYSRAQLHEREPALAREGLVGGAGYHDAATDDARLTLANARGAAIGGAIVLNHVALSNLRHSSGVAVAELQDMLTGARFQALAGVVVNATGPWSDEVRRMESPRARPAVLGSKGVHIAVPRERLGNRSAITLLAPSDERVLFALPAETHAIIGTTETPADAPPGEIRAHMSDVRYLLETANHYFPAAQLTEDDVVSAWAGIRPLAMPTHGESAGSASREHALTWSDHGVLTVSGGKLTTYRPVAAQVVEAAAERIGKTVRHSITDEAPLPGGDIESLEAEVAAATEASGAADVGRHLAWSYGSDWRIVWGVAAREATLAERIVPELPYLKAEIPYTVRHEMACTLGDILIRRTHIAFETRDHGVNVAPTVARIAAGTAGWSEEDIARQLADYRAEVARIFTIER